MTLLTIAFASETKRVPTGNLNNWNQLCVLIQSLFWEKSLPKHRVLKYVDEEGDLISVSCDSDVVEMLAMHPDHPRTLMIMAKGDANCSQNQQQETIQPISFEQFDHGVPMIESAQFHLAPGTRFRKTWEFSNSGARAWPEGCSMLHLEGERFGSFPSFVVAALQPGETMEAEVHFIAPMAPGNYTGVWQLVDPYGFALSDRVSVTVRVSGSVRPAVFPGFAPNTNLDVFPGLHTVQQEQQEQQQPFTSEKLSAECRRDLLNKLHVFVAQAAGSRLRRVWRINNAELAAKCTACTVICSGTSSFSTFSSWIVMPNDGDGYVVELNLTVPTEKGRYHGEWSLVAPDGSVVDTYEIHVEVLESYKVPVFPGLAPDATTIDENVCKYGYDMMNSFIAI